MNRILTAKNKGFPAGIFFYPPEKSKKKRYICRDFKTNPMTNKYILLLCGLLVGCQTSQKKEAEATPCQTIDLTTVFEQEPTEISLDEWAKEVRFVPLETSDSVLLTPYIWQLAYYQDQFVIYNNDKIYLFDNAGKFIRMIGSKGEGPEEYLRPGTPSVDEAGIHLEDGGKRIKTYGWDGKWKQTTNLPARLQHVNEVIPLPDGRNIGYVQNISGQEPIRMYLYRDSTVLDSIPYARKFTPGEINMVFYSECQTFTDRGDIFVKEMFNDTIYQITNENKLVPRWAIDAGKYRLEEGERYQLQDPRNSLFVEKNAAQISVIDRSNGQLYLAAIWKEKPYLITYDEQTGKVENLKLTYPEHTFAFKEGNTFLPSFISTDGRYLIGVEPQENDENSVLILVERD